MGQWKNPRSNFYAIGRNFMKKSVFPSKAQLFRKKCLLFAKISYDLFSRQLWFFKFSPCFRQKLQKAIRPTNPLLLGRNHWENAFSGEMWNTQEKPKDFKKNSGKKSVFVKKPIYQGRIKNPKILGENPRSGYTGNNYNAWSSVSNRKAATSCYMYVMHNTA